ncbi:hypothetical protein [Roseomonas sp. 18066]|uniref:hypothetical protein n=1 Tax=Roseomonas sp. 18066 TaxID=2681412 RepID=UPI001359FE0F|nr:hypothetical protein [Roseomonas sp. 18066]
MVMEEVWRLAALLRETEGAPAALGLDLAQASDVEEVSAILARHGYPPSVEKPLTDAELDGVSGGMDPAMAAALEAIQAAMQAAMDNMHSITTSMAGRV